MKIRTVEFYVDLYPNWHEAKNSELFLTAYVQPCVKYPESMRVKIIVDLPEYKKSFNEDKTVEAAISIPLYDDTTNNTKECSNPSQGS